MNCVKMTQKPWYVKHVYSIARKYQTPHCDYVYQKSPLLHHLKKISAAQLFHLINTIYASLHAVSCQIIIKTFHEINYIIISKLNELLPQFDLNYFRSFDRFDKLYMIIMLLLLFLAQLDDIFFSSCLRKIIITLHLFCINLLN